MARHIEQPGSRHSKPASMKTLSSPSASAWRLTMPEPGTTSTSLTLAAFFLPLATLAAARRSSMRELVQEPMKTLSTLISLIGVSALRPMYCSARSMPARFCASASLAGFGTRPPTASTCSGEVPQVTCGSIFAASSSTTASNFASASDCSVFQ